MGSRLQPGAVKDAAVLGSVKTKPSGWSRRAASLDRPCAAAAGFRNRAGRMLAARAEQKNAGQKDKNGCPLRS